MAYDINSEFNLVFLNLTSILDNGNDYVCNYDYLCQN